MVRAVVAVALLNAVSTAAGFGTGVRTVTIVRSVEAGEEGELSSICPAGYLPDSMACVPFPDNGERQEGPGMPKEVGAHRDRSGQWQLYEQIPRRPDRSASYADYVYPTEGVPVVVSGYDLDRPDPNQRRGRGFADTGHGGIDLALPRGAPVRALKLPFQRGDAEVVFVGTLFGKTVVTRHTIAETGRNRDYLMLHGHLDETAPNLGPGAVATEGTLLGTVGDSGSEGRVHLHLEVRQVRDGVDPSLLRSTSLSDRTVSIVCDPRNVLPSRGVAGGDLP
jgi:murein DD-endopeptidase MepM/ murein hydrolase activator NlpD